MKVGTVVESPKLFEFDICGIKPDFLLVMDLDEKFGNKNGFIIKVKPYIFVVNFFILVVRCCLMIVATLGNLHSPQFVKVPLFIIVFISIDDAITSYSRIIFFVAKCIFI